ncbi:MAG: hypothetical protein H2060_08700 [Azoarcus sp.]|nr:hypothetical protein [Azoarcus sp.]
MNSATTHWLRCFGMAALALAAVAAFLGKDWLAGIGLSSLALALLPCALMCAAGLCMRHGTKHPTSSLPPEDPRG